MRALTVVLASPPDPEPVASHDAWRRRHAAATALAKLPIDQAILGGFSADRAGYAFASGYQAALRVLVPDLPRDAVACLSVTERGGNRPRAIETRLSPRPGAPGGYLLSGKKRWATLGGQADVLLVVASTGVDANGKNRLRVVRVPAGAPGLRREPMPEPPFVPEIAHDEIELADVTVSEADLCPGDGYAAYVKPFRTIEDIHVNAAMLAYLIREVRANALPLALAERFAGLLVALHGLAAADPGAPDTHVALAGVLDLARGPIDELGRLWASSESPAHARWERDRVLLTVASGVRAERLVRAWDRLAGQAREEESSGLDP